MHKWQIKHRPYNRYTELFNRNKTKNRNTMNRTQNIQKERKSIQPN